MEETINEVRTVPLSLSDRLLGLEEEVEILG